MATNDFLPFAAAGGANVLAQADWLALAARLSGYTAGVANSAQINKGLRQSAAMSAMIGQFITDYGALDALDNGNIAQLEANFVAALGKLFPRTLTGDLTLYVRPDGNDANDGLTNTAGGAFRQIDAAVKAAVRRYNTAGFQVTIQIADGTYGPVEAARTGTTNLSLIGNSGNPSNVLVGGGTTHAITATTGSTLSVSGVKVTSASGAGMLAFDRSAIRFSLCEFGACAQQHLYATSASLISADGDYLITGGASEFMASGSGSIVQVNGRTGTITTAMAFSTAFAHANNGTILCNGAAWPGAGSVTGTRYISEVVGVIYTAGAGANFVPGSVAGFTTTGGTYI